MLAKLFPKFSRTGTIKDAEKFEVHILASGYLENDQGNFNSFKVFPADFQLAPITSFKEIDLNGIKQLIIGGNSFKVNTYHGSYSSLKGLIAKTINDYKPVSNYGIEPFNTQIKQIETINLKSTSLLIVVSNNDELKVYSYQN